MTVCNSFTPSIKSHTLSLGVEEDDVACLFVNLLCSEFTGVTVRIIRDVAPKKGPKLCNNRQQRSPKYYTWYEKALHASSLYGYCYHVLHLTLSLSLSLTWYEYSLLDCCSFSARRRRNTHTRHCQKTQEVDPDHARRSSPVLTVSRTIKTNQQNQKHVRCSTTHQGVSHVSTSTYGLETRCYYQVLRPHQHRTMDRSPTIDCVCPHPVVFHWKKRL